MTNEQKIDNFIKEFGSDKILERISDNDIIMNVGNEILTSFSDEELMGAMTNLDCLLDHYSDMELIDYLEDCGYKVYEGSKDELVINKIKELCRILKPNGYIDKEEAQKLICDYLDFWMDRSF